MNHEGWQCSLIIVFFVAAEGLRGGNTPAFVVWIRAALTRRTS
jgi:hypothetical protein